MKNVDYDLVIIGGGPAGLTAGMYASRARLNVILIEKMATGGQILTTDWLENYPGFPEGISGFDLTDKMTEQAKKFGLQIESEEVISLDLSKEEKKIVLSSKEITAGSIIIASGASPRKTGVPGENKLYGKGISFCATCDGPFFKDKVVAAIGGGDTAVQESVYLTKFAKKVYLIHRRDELRATKILQERALKNDKIEFVWDSVIKSFNADFFGNFENVTVSNVKTNEDKTLNVDGSFIMIGTTPNTAFIGDSLELNSQGFIVVDNKMETSVKGVFAVGDVRNTPLRQVATAVGDAAIAAVSAEHYISDLQGNN